jgi:HEAT repeat protein
MTQRLTVFVAVPLLLGIALAADEPIPKDKSAPKVPEADKTVAELIRKLGDDDFKVREAATKQLLAIGAPAADAVAEALKSDKLDPETARRLRLIAEKLPTVANRVRWLQDVFRDPEARSSKLEASRKAIAALAELGPPAVPYLIDGILGDHDTVGPYSYLALKEIGKDAVEGVRARWAKLDDAQRWRLMEFRGEFDKEAAAQYALSCLTHIDMKIRGDAVAFAGRHREQRAKKQLLKMLNNDAPALRWGVMDALANLGGDDVSAELTKLLEKDSWAAKGTGLPVPEGAQPPWWPDGRPVVIECLKRLKAKAAAPALLRVLQEKGEGKAYLGMFIIPLLGEFGYRNAVPELQWIVKGQKDQYVGLLAAEALFQLGDRSARPLVLEVLGKGGSRVACSILARYGTREDVPVLVKCLDDEDWGVRKHACEGLERITGEKNRAKGWEAISEHDAPVWKKWWATNKDKYEK